jgi:hypothetical protein
VWHRELLLSRETARQIRGKANGLSVGELLRFFCDAGALNEWKDFAAVCERVLVLNMCVEVGTGTCLIFASGTCQFFTALRGATCERRLGLRGERNQDGHNPE